MATVAALMPTPAHRESVRAAASSHDLVWAQSWRELSDRVREDPIAAAVAELETDGRGDGVLRILDFAERYPLTPVVVCGDADGRALFRLGKASASEVIIAPDITNRALVAEVIERVLAGGLPSLLDARLRDRVGDDGRAFVRDAAARITERIQVPDLAERLDVSVSTLERRCRGWGLPTPGRLLLWLRTLYGVRRLLEPGRSAESVAGQLGYSSGAAFRRALKATVGCRPTPLRNRRGLERALAAFLEECPGDIAGRGR